MVLGSSTFRATSAIRSASTDRVWWRRSSTPRSPAACNGNIIRISNQNAQAANAPIQEYWLDLGRQIWHGPHTFPASVIQPFMGTFILAAPSIPGYLWQSDPVQNATSVFVENTVQMQWQYRTTFLPDTDQMSNN